MYNQFFFLQVQGIGIIQFNCERLFFLGRGWVERVVTRLLWLTSPLMLKKRIFSKGRGTSRTRNHSFPPKTSEDEGRRDPSKKSLEIVDKFKEPQNTKVQREFKIRPVHILRRVFM